ALVLVIIVCSFLVIALGGAFGVVLICIGWLVLLGVIAHHKGRSVAAWTIPFLIIPPIIGLCILPFLSNKSGDQELLETERQILKAERELRLYKTRAHLAQLKRIPS